MSKHFTTWQNYFDKLPANAHMSQSQHHSLKKLMGRCPEGVALGKWEGLFLKVNARARSQDITIDSEHEAKGAKWIKGQISKIRKSVGNPTDATLFELCNTVGIKHFYFGGFVDATPMKNKHFAPRWREAVPVWIVERNDGVRFSYAYGAWQGYSQVIVNPPGYLEGA